jgi:hypothetical protein
MRKKREKWLRVHKFFQARDKDDTDFTFSYFFSDRKGKKASTPLASAMRWTNVSGGWLRGLRSPFERQGVDTRVLQTESMP